MRTIQWCDDDDYQAFPWNSGELFCAFCGDDHDQGAVANVSDRWLLPCDFDEAMKALGLVQESIIFSPVQLDQDGEPIRSYRWVSDWQPVE